MAKKVGIDEVEARLNSILQANLENKLKEIDKDRGDNLTPLTISDWITEKFRTPHSFPALSVSAGRKEEEPEERIFEERVTFQITGYVSERINGEMEALRISEAVEQVLEEHSTLNDLIPGGKLEGTRYFTPREYPSPPIFGFQTSFQVYLEEAPAEVKPLMMVDGAGKISLHPDVDFQEVDGIGGGIVLSLTENKLQVTGEVLEEARGVGTLVCTLDSGGNIFISEVMENQTQDPVMTVDNVGTLRLQGELQVYQTLAADRLLECYSGSGNLLVEGSIKSYPTTGDLVGLYDSGDLQVFRFSTLVVRP